MVRWRMLDPDGQLASAAGVAAWSRFGLGWQWFCAPALGHPCPCRPLHTPARCGADANHHDRRHPLGGKGKWYPSLRTIVCGQAFPNTSRIILLTFWQGRQRPSPRRGVPILAGRLRAKDCPVRVRATRPRAWSSSRQRIPVPQEAWSRSGRKLAQGTRHTHHSLGPFLQCCCNSPIVNQRGNP